MARQAGEAQGGRRLQIRRSLAVSALSNTLWSALLLLLIAVAVPASGVLWFMSEAMRNERLASQQKLRDAYRVQLV